MNRKILVLLVSVAAVATSCGGAPSGPQTFAVDVDAKSTPKEKAQYSAYFPGEVRVRGGDRVRFRNRSTEAPHTITFGVNADRSNQPPIITAEGENPVVTTGCQSTELPTAKMTSCPDKKLTAFDGEGYWNSGYLMPRPAPKSAGRKNITVRLAEDIPTGEYTYICILHPFMAGSIQVVDKDEDRSLAGDVREGAQEGTAAAVETAKDVEVPKLESEGDDTVVVAAGWGDRTIAFNRFAPKEIEIETGTTVRWDAKSPYEPHSVTFDAPFDGPEDPRAFAPGGVESGGHYAGGFAHSGVYGAKGTPFAGTYSLRFTQAGTYDYVCVLHPGMTGVVKVTA